MEARKAMHARRLQDALSQIPYLLSDGINVFSSEFETWQERTLQSLTELFTKDGGYTRRFTFLRFWHARASIGRGHTWTGDDQELYESDMKLAKQILIDALEELQLPPEPSALDNLPRATVPQVVLNVTNVLSQMTDIKIENVINRIDSLAMTPVEKEQVKKAAMDLNEEANGPQRWPVLAKLVDAVKSIGGVAYKEVAIPLILEMLKKQAGL